MAGRPSLSVMCKRKFSLATYDKVREVLSCVVLRRLMCLNGVLYLDALTVVLCKCWKILYLVMPRTLTGAGNRTG